MAALLAAGVAGTWGWFNAGARHGAAMKLEEAVFLASRMEEIRWL